jgi:hypothetical protein
MTRSNGFDFLLIGWRGIIASPQPLFATNPLRASVARRQGLFALLGRQFALPSGASAQSTACISKFLMLAFSRLLPKMLSVQVD